MKIQYIDIANRKFLQVGRHCIPVDAIKCVDFNAPNGGAWSSVSIDVAGVEEKYYWANENAEALRAFLTGQASEDEL